MPRFILIDTYTGNIAGDTANFPRFALTEQTPIDAIRLLDESNRETRFDYKIVPLTRLDWCDGYLVYDASALTFLPPIEDGADRQTVDTVELLCRFVCAVQTIDRRPPGDDDYDDDQ